MSDIFASQVTIPQLTEVEEYDLIARAKNGDADAQDTLIHTYAPVIKAAVTNFLRQWQDPQEREERRGDLQQDAMIGFLTAVQEHDLGRSPRLASRVKQVLWRELSETNEMAMAVPSRTRSRFLAAIRRADQDVDLALKIATEEFGMLPETFWAVYAVTPLRTESLEGRRDALQAHFDADYIGALGNTGEREVWADDFLAVEDAILAAVALGALDESERDLLRTSFGFADYGEPVPYREVAHRFGLSPSTTQRRLEAAMTKMRVRMGVLPPEALDKKKTA